MNNQGHNKLIEEYKNKYYNDDIKTPVEFLNTLKTECVSLLKSSIASSNILNSLSEVPESFIAEEEIDKIKDALTEIHQKLYLYYYTKFDNNKYNDLVQIFKNKDNNIFIDILRNLFEDSKLVNNIENFKTKLNELYNTPNTLGSKINSFLDLLINYDNTKLKNIFNILRLKDNKSIYISEEIKKTVNEIDNDPLNSTKSTIKSFLETILITKKNINDSSFNITFVSNNKNISNQIKQLLYFCELFIYLEENDLNTKINDLKKQYDVLINLLKDHIKKFNNQNNNNEYSIKTPETPEKSLIQILRGVNVMKDILNNLKKYILNESLIDDLITEYNKHLDNAELKAQKEAEEFNKHLDNAELKAQKEAEEFKKVVKSEIEANKKEFTDLIPLTPTEKIRQIGQFSTSTLSTLSTSFENIQSKGLDYLDTVIKIIIFLIFLNLFITTYFYFTTSIEATANRSNCGGASLCEAETHRHLFLEDNGNDKARDIYIIIVVIFSIYLLSEIFKNSKDGIDFDDNNISVPIFVLFIYFIFIVGTISGIIHNTLPRPPEINLASSIAFIFYLLIIGIIFIVKKDDALDNIITKVLTVVIALTIIGFEIGILAEGSKYDLFQGFSDDGGSGLLNPNFNANTALHLIFLVFYLTFFIVVFKFNKDIKSLHIWGLVFLGFILFTLFIFILLSSLDFKNTEYTYHLQNIKHSTSSMQYFVLILPLVCLWCFRSELKNAIKLIVLYYAILFIIYLFYVYFVNHSNETGILSLESFQLYNWESEDKNEKIKGSKEELNYKKELNKANTGFVFILLIILIVIGGLNDNPNLDNIIYGIIVFIIASYITGIVYLLYSKVFPIQQASFNYKKNLVDINNEISQHIKVEDEEHTIDINKIRIFKIANDAKDIENIHTRIKQERNDATKDETEKEKHMKNIRDIFSEISPKGSSYEDYRSQSIHQMQYEEYIYRLFSNWTNTDFKFQESFGQTIFGDDDFEQQAGADTYRSNSYKLYNNIILKLPKTKAELLQYIQGRIDISTLIEKIEANNEANTFIQEVFKIPKTHNIEYVIKKNYKYVTGEEGEIQKYNVLSNKELDCLYYAETTEDVAYEPGNKLEESIKTIKKITDLTKLTITNIATTTTTTTTTTDKTIYKLNQDIFDHYKSNHTEGNNVFIKLNTITYKNILNSDMNVPEYDKLNPAFYTIGYDYENYTYKEEDHQQMNKDTAYSIPARYYACSYLNYFPNEDGSMSKVKFAKNIKEDNYNPLNTKNTFVDRIAKSYNANAEATKIELAPEKFHFLLVFLVILAIIILMFLFNIIKKYFTGDVYTPQMYVLGILGVFLTTFIFGEVIFARIK